MTARETTVSEATPVPESYDPPRIESILKETDLKREALYAGGTPK